MTGYFSFTLVIIGLILALIITRKELSTNQNKFSKKGIYKLVLILTVIFFSVVTEVFFSPESWM